MDFTLIIGLLGGLALFLYGMQMMSSGLEAAAGNRMKKILEKLTANRFLGVAVGAGITALIQSSSATTVMVVGFVNSGLMTLKQAVWIIMGANIGTTITAQLITLDVGAFAPVFAFLGVAMIVFLKKPSLHHYGHIIAGFGMLFIGMDMMSSSMLPLRESEAFVGLMTQFTNPVLGILVGMVFTAIIQSSSASIGILQALAMSGLIGLENAVFVLFGQNIGTCITSVIASIGTNRSAKRTTLIHLIFNLLGTAIFTTVCLTTPLTPFVKSLTPNDVTAQIANMHTFFNVATTVLLLPFGSYMAKLAAILLPDKPEPSAEGHTLLYIQHMPKEHENQIGNSIIVVNSIRRELLRMMDMTKENISDGFLAVMEGSSQRLEKVTQTEEYIDFLNKEISKYTSHFLALEANEQDSVMISSYFKISGNLERIGDHAMNLCEYTQRLESKSISLSPAAQQEISQMRQISLDALSLLYHLREDAADVLSRVSALEQQIDDMTERFRENQIERMRSSSCEAEAGILYSEMLTDFERIGDHILNIAEIFAKTQLTGE